MDEVMSRELGLNAREFGVLSPNIAHTLFFCRQLVWNM